MTCGRLFHYVSHQLSWKVWCKIIVFSNKALVLHDDLLSHCVCCRWVMWHLWQVNKCDSCDCTLFKAIINVATDVQRLTIIVSYRQNFQRMLRYHLRWTCITCEEVGKRFCISKANFPCLRSVTVRTCLVYPGFSYISDHILITWELPGIWFCSTAFVQMSFRVAALPFLR